MTVTEKIIEHIHRLPEPIQIEVLDFVEYLENKAEAEERREWSSFSASQALRDMETEAPRTIRRLAGLYDLVPD